MVVHERAIWRLERLDGLVATSDKPTYHERIDEAMAWTVRFMQNLVDAADRAAAREA
jgi:hypothetical protein